MWECIDARVVAQQPTRRARSARSRGVNWPPTMSEKTMARCSIRFSPAGKVVHDVGIAGETVAGSRMLQSGDESSRSARDVEPHAREVRGCAADRFPR